MDLKEVNSYCYYVQELNNKFCKLNSIFPLFIRLRIRGRDKI